MTVGVPKWNCRRDEGMLESAKRYQVGHGDAEPLQLLEFGDGGNDAGDLLAFELGIERQREGFLGGTFGLREITRFVAE